jgi:peptidoglycan/LPS O-acetylase OafA/YrhL
LRDAPAGSAAFDLRDTDALKGVGILAIVLHNFFHSLPHAVIENEFAFVPGNFQRFLGTVTDPRQTIQTLFSFLGHFGVQLFIFLSAYGLALKYWTTPSWSAFVWSRIRKLYPMFFLAVGLWLVLRVFEYGLDFPAFVWTQADELALTALAVINLVPGYGLPPVGPWWFLAFIVQFYCLWPALARLCRRTGAAGLLIIAVLCVAFTALVGPILVQKWAIDLVETPIGHMPELCLGVAVARYGIRVGPLSALVALGVFILGNLYDPVWPLTFVSVLLILLYAYQLTGRFLRNTRFITTLATVSMPLFFVNGFLRSPFRLISIHFGRWYVTLLAGVLFAAFSVAVAYGMLKLEQRLFSRQLSRQHTPELAG